MQASVISFQTSGAQTCLHDFVYIVKTQKIVSASKKTYLTEEVLQKIFGTDDENFSSDIDSEFSEDNEKACNRVSIFF